MPKQKYTPKRERTSFKRLGEGLRARESRIQEQQQIRIDEMKLAALRSEKLDNQFISGISDKNRFEQGVLREKQELENKVRTRKYEAFAKFADSDVKRLEGEANALKERADFLKDFAPKFAENLGKLAQGSLMGLDKLKGQAELRELRKNKVFDILTDNAAIENFKHGEHVTYDQWKLDPKAANTLHDKTWKVSSYWASKRLAHWFKQNKDLIKSDFEASYLAHTGENIDKDNVNDAYDFQAYLLLTKLGISPNSEGGREIMNMAESWGHKERKQFQLKHEADRTLKDIQPLILNLQSINLDQTYKGTDGTVLTGIQQYKSVLEQLEMKIKNGTFATESGYQTPIDTKMSPADMRDKAIEYIIDNDDSLTVKKLERILGITISDTGEKGKQKIVPYNQMHTLRADALMDKFLKKEANEASLLTAKKESIGLTAYEKIRDDVKRQAWKFDAKGDEIEFDNEAHENQVKKRWFYTKVNEIHNSPELRGTKAQALAYAEVEYYGDHTTAGHYAYIKTALLDGKLGLALKRLNSLSGKQQADIVQEVETFRKLEESGYSYGKGNKTVIGFEAVIARNEALIKTRQKSARWTGVSQLGDNAREKLYEMNVRWKERYDILVGQGIKELDAANQADAYIEAEWEKGMNSEPGKHWLSHKEGTKRGEPVTFYDITDQNNTDIRLANAITAVRDVKNSTEPMQITDANLTLAMTQPAGAALIEGWDGKDPYDLLNNVSVISDQRVIKLMNQISNALQSPEHKAGQQISIGDFDIPEAVHIFLKHYKDNEGKTPSLAHVLHTIYKFRSDRIKDLPKIDWNMPTDGGTLVWLQNDRQYVNPVNKGAVSKYNSGVAITGKRPTKDQIRRYVNKEAGIMTLFAETYGIKLKEDENGVLQFDGEEGLRKYLKNGALDTGLNINGKPLTAVEMLRLSGYSQLVSDAAIHKLYWDDVASNPILQNLVTGFGNK